MVKAWYIDDETNDVLEQEKNPSQFISQEKLYEITGIELFKLNIDTLETDGVLDKIKKERGYAHEDELVALKDRLPGYEEREKLFHTEHMHSDEEIRLVLEGSGYLDVRDKNDRWIRIDLHIGDMFILPSGIYHRFTHNSSNNYKVKRIFPEGKKFVTYNRPADDMECRKEYVANLAKGFVATTNSGSCSY